eukprot:CAMPEP_0204202872 /NCGR_PEP_ID=MMETSP0361-20130328/68542_1 /ASSEMBLY_ACC=CAM_ASM_000343 /TAXON_ID=268821 /ORGANISM="Scrippsiella Hangoei, Strain SHTV-5" /LENGTH=44 /DNA_ID= /DNA_START= /DNA_END= /DNA_ORIENTATION=
MTVAEAVVECAGGEDEEEVDAEAASGPEEGISVIAAIRKISRYK